jgi:hypothetical protein
MRFIETPVFTRVITSLLDDDDYRRLQMALMLRSEQGSLIRGSGGLRKVRWARPGGGKSGGLRVIYFWSPDATVLYMLYAYAKNKQGDLTPAQTRALSQLVREEFK